MSNKVISKGELLKLVATETGLKATQVKSVVDSLFSNIENQVKEGKKVSFIGFGVWDSKLRKARTGRNPQTGEAVEIKEKTVFKHTVKFN